MSWNMCAINCTGNVDGSPYDMFYTGNGIVSDDNQAEDMWSSMWAVVWYEATMRFTYNPWLFSLLGSTMVGLAGVLPLLIIPIDEGADLKNGASAGTLKILLSFAVGGLLGDVFLHLLPEAWENDHLRKVEDAADSIMPCGLWVLSGFLVFVIVEKMFAFENEPERKNDSTVSEEFSAEREMENNNTITIIGENINGFTKHCVAKKEQLEEMAEVQTFFEGNATNGYVQVNGIGQPLKNGYKRTPIALVGNKQPNGLPIHETEECLRRFAKTNGFTSDSSLKKRLLGSQRANSSSVVDSKKSNVTTGDKPKHITGYLNLMANSIDNFTHGLAVGGSFLMSFRLGALTTFAILVHEIPHEVGDFAILLRSGFSRWDAARAQLLTASGGIFGASAAILFSGGGVEAKTSWILPFTAGGFLHIGLVTILPELLKESSPKESLKQLGALLFGIVLMACLTLLCD